ncbi:helicase [Acidovorax sp. SRB_14]|uniref:ATP-dependent DNA helicase n=1 Tax=unclassified Acidovorax TaxID=2684926 RepID=UPI00145DE6B2|nr:MULTISPECIES: ATP-dependent DNA helicase [unclassified Acidovorax]NMM76430.1 helicase [Acidovorax sp. SRB_24]NMM79600.1 helicase [Acidovorax sp. SRB_14]
MTVVAAVQHAFAADGVLARTQANFRPREGQTAMALAVAEAIEAGGALVVEAGTGVGKTFAYLVPALLSGERALLSTATKALQDQLYARDLPQLLQALGLPLRIALLKGRSSYLCHHRLGLARQHPAAQEGAVLRALADIEQWAHGTRSGDLAELPALDERSPAIPLVTSSRDNCLGAPCPSFQRCHVNLARREALAADVVVINHHLFFADVAVRESGVAELLPTVGAVVFDEAHQLNEIGVQFLGTQVGTGQLLNLVRDLLATGLKLARGLVDWQGVAAQVERAARDLRLAAGPARSGARLRWFDGLPEGVPAAAWRSALQQVVHALALAQQALDLVTESAPDFVRLQERCVALHARMELFAGPCVPEAVRWLDVGMHLRMVESPLDIAQAMQQRLRGPLPGPEGKGAGGDATGTRESAAHPRAWIFTSATLGDDPQLRWFTEPCGLEDATVLRVGSPFDYAAQAGVYVPEHLPKPSDPGHSVQLARWVGDAAARIGGRTLVLTTTLKALRTMGDVLQTRFQGSGALEVLVQGQWPKRRLMERLRAGAQPGQPGCILVASASFWEGFDVPGDALQLVVIDKLPFPPPGDPVVEARSRRLELAGRSAFRDYSIPEAAVALKQGAGRLIRHESDRGLLVVGDTRLVSMGYGRRLMAALPPMRRIGDAQAFDAALEALTRPSTKALPCP